MISKHSWDNVCLRVFMIDVHVVNTVNNFKLLYLSNLTIINFEFVCNLICLSLSQRLVLYEATYIQTNSIDTKHAFKVLM
jgi:hypothetical protein